MSRAKEQLIARIEAAFPDSPPPPYAKALDKLTAEERRPFRRRWQRIVSPKLPYAALSFFDDAAFRYYLPAFLITSLRWPRRAGNVVEATLWTLIPPRRRADPRWPEFLRWMGGLTPGQKSVVRDFLRPYAEVDDDARRALRSYWDRAISG